MKTENFKFKIENHVTGEVRYNDYMKSLKKTIKKWIKLENDFKVFFSVNGELK